MLILAIAWALMAMLYYQAFFEVEVATFEWNPYTILGVDKGAELVKIEKRYCRLLQTNHPGRGGDAQRFAQIAKAYRTLTDEKMRRNYMKYGDPNGPSGELFGVV